MQTWIKLVISGPSYPVERVYHTACYLGRSPQGHPQLLISGGLGGGSAPLGDFWTLDIDVQATTLICKEVSKLVCPSVVHIHTSITAGPPEVLGAWWDQK